MKIEITTKYTTTNEFAMKLLRLGLFTGKKVQFSTENGVTTVLESTGE